MKNIPVFRLKTKPLLLAIITCELFLLIFLLPAYFSSRSSMSAQDFPPITQNEQWLKQSIFAVDTAFAQTVDVTKYTQSPYNFPPPTDPIEPSEAQVQLGNTLGSLVADYQSFLTSKFDPKYVDPFLSVIWTIAIEGIDSPYFWNCQDVHKDINRGCAGGYYSGGWQVGFGIQVSQASTHLVDDFNQVHGSNAANDAAKVKQAGQAVIDGSGGRITNPSSFPQETIVTLVNEASQGNTASQQAIAILLMDQKLGAIAVAREVAGDIAAGDNWRATMEGWGSYYVTNMQRFSNRMAGMAAKYTGTAGSSSGGTGGSGTATLTLTVRALPGANNSYIINKATAQVTGGSSSGGSNTDNNGPVNPDATCPGVGPITCGTLAGGCHCTADYQSNVTGCNGACSWCQAPNDSSKWAVDITNPVDAPVYIPKISVGGEVHTITCKGYGNQDGSVEPNQVIQIVSCADDETDESIWMQFHHSKRSNPVIEGKEYKSGQTVGYSAAMEFFAAPPHVHFQMGVGGACGSETSGCVEPTDYVQCNG